MDEIRKINEEKYLKKQAAEQQRERDIILTRIKNEDMK